MMRVLEDKYNGVTVDCATLPNEKEDFYEGMARILEEVKGKKLLWVKIPLEKSAFIPVLTGLGFEFHHCRSSYLMLLKRLDEQAIVPTAQNYVVGVGAVVLDGRELLVVRDRFSEGYKLPGGHADNNESLKEALCREVREETGVEVELESIVNLGHFARGQFGESCVYVVCRAQARSREIAIHDSEEIVEARWLDVEAFLSSEHTNNYNRSVVAAALKGGDQQLVEQHIALKVQGAEVFF